MVMSRSICVLLVLTDGSSLPLQHHQLLPIAAAYGYPGKKYGRLAC